MKSLNEVIDIVGLKRRAIQEYEKAGVADTPTTTNKYGHLLYDEDHIRHLWLLRFYKELGYKTPDIKQILADPDYDIHEALADHIIALEKKKEDLEHLISVAKVLNELELYPNTISNDITGCKDLSFDDTISILGTASNILLPIKDSEELPKDLMTDEDWENCVWYVDLIMYGFHQQLKYDSSPVQETILAIHNTFAKLFSDSVLMFSWNTIILAPGSKLASDIEKEYGPGSSDFLYHALKAYCATHKDNPTDNKFFSALKTMRSLGYQKYLASSEEVQLQVAKIHEFFRGIPIFNSQRQFNLLQYLAELYGSKSMKKLIDNGNERGISWFISRSIEIYCQNHRMDTEGGKNE